MTTPLHRRRAFYIAAVAGIAALVLGFWLARDLAVVIGANMFFITYLVLSLIGFPKLTPEYLKKNADSADEPVSIIFLVTLATVAVACQARAVIRSDGT